MVGKSLLLLPTILVGLSSALPNSDADLPFHLHARAVNKDGTTPVYKVADADIESRVKDLLPRMTVQEKVAQLYVFSIRDFLQNST